MFLNVVAVLLRFLESRSCPPEIDSTWEGCVATDPSNDKCVVLPTAIILGSTQAECTGKESLSCLYVFLCME